MADHNVKSFYTGVDDWTVVVDKYGNGKGTREQFQNSRPQDLNPIITGLQSSSSFAQDHVHAELGKIITQLNAAWRSDTADDAVKSLQDLQTDAASISQSTGKLSSSLGQFQTDWSSLKNEASSLGDGDDHRAHDIFNRFTKAENDCKGAWANQLYYHTPVAPKEAEFTPGPGPGPGNFPGPGPSTFPGPGHPISHLGTPGNYPGTPGNYPGGPGHYPGGGPGHYPGGGPGHYPGAPGNYPGTPGNYPGYGGGSGFPGAGETGTSIAGVGGGPGGGGGGGIGAGSGLGAGAGLGTGGGIGAGGGVGSGPMGAGAGSAAGAAGFGPGALGAGTGTGGAGAGARGMMAPMHGGGQGGDSDRERATWLSEDDDVWGAGDAPPGVIA